MFHQPAEGQPYEPCHGKEGDRIFTLEISYVCGYRRSGGRGKDTYTSHIYQQQQRHGWDRAKSVTPAVTHPGNKAIHGGAGQSQLPTVSSAHLHNWYMSPWAVINKPLLHFCDLKAFTLLQVLLGISRNRCWGLVSYNWTRRGGWGVGWRQRGGLVWRRHLTIKEQRVSSRNAASCHGDHYIKVFFRVKYTVCAWTAVWGW